MMYLTADSPAHPNKLRTTYYGARYYVDHLPADEVWPQDTERYPSVSTIKGAMNKEFRKKLPSGNVYPLDAVRAGQVAMGHVDWLADQDEEDGVEFVANKAGAELRSAGKRGSGVHQYIEDRILGRDPLPGMTPVEAQPYLATADRMLEELQLTPIYLEHCVFNREIGYAGTFDAICEVDGLDGGTYLIDWKSRGADSKHGAYPEEAMQLGAYAACQGDNGYLITEVDGEAVRRPLPDIDGGLIVSIKP